jgi:hypothetical protein
VFFIYLTELHLLEYNYLVDLLINRFNFFNRCFRHAATELANALPILDSIPVNIHAIARGFTNPWFGNIESSFFSKQVVFRTEMLIIAVEA